MITTGDWQDALEPIARKNYDVGKEEIPAEKDMFYSVRKGSKLTETYLELGDIGPMSEFTGSVNYSDVSQGYKFTVTAKEFAQGIKIQRKFAETDQLDVIEGLNQLLGRSQRRRLASDIYFPFNNAFNTSITTLDGLQICSSAHTSNQGGSSQSNRGTTAFSAVALEATRVLMKKFRTNKDNIFGVNPDMIVCGLDLEEAVYEVINSKGKVNTANNNVNFNMGKYKMISSPEWFEDTNNWFVVDSRLMKLMNAWNDIVKPEFNQAKDFDGFVAKYSAYMFYSYAVRDWRWAFGHEVA